MAESWQEFEKRVRDTAHLMWGVEPRPREIAGVRFDCVLELSWNHYVIVEITKNNSLDKIRGDINRIVLARNTLVAEQVVADSFIVVSKPPTNAMMQAGASSKIRVVTPSVFRRLFFDGKVYVASRAKLQFGSAVNPETGLPDMADYVPVQYKDVGTGRSISLEAMSGMLERNHKIVLTGEYGSGKSRCIKEIFEILNKGDRIDYFLSIDLRRCWGLQSANEIIRRHLDEVGMSGTADAVVRAFNSGAITFLLDGFDEIAAQSWSKNTSDLKEVRMSTLKGVRDIVKMTKRGVIICGREHYFNSSEEMLQCLGLKKKDAEIIKCEDEFTDEQMEQFLENFSADLILPDWLPKRPLMCQAVSHLDQDSLSRMFTESNGDVEFWQTFMDVVCEREARIRDVLNKDSIFDILKTLSRTTRTKNGNLGPLSFSEIQQAFVSAVGQSPTDESVAMLQRLPGLGRVGADSDERQFIDSFILEGLRAVDVSSAVENNEHTILQDMWINPLGVLGQRILSEKISDSGAFQKYRGFANQASNSKNRLIAGDIVASAIRGSIELNFNDLYLSEAVIQELDIASPKVIGLTISDSLIEEIRIPQWIGVGLQLRDCQIGKAFGITDPRAMPAWMKNCEVAEYESAENVSRIKTMQLKPQHRILMTILKKLFLQKGAGRQEEALLRGLGQIDRRGHTNTIIRVLMREKMITTARGDHGMLYIPHRHHTARVKTIIAELATSRDPIWLEIDALGS